MKRRLLAGGWKGIASVIAPVCVGVLLAYAWTAAAAHVGSGRIAANVSPAHVRIAVAPAADWAPAWAVRPISINRAAGAPGSRAPHRAVRHRLRNRPHRPQSTSRCRRARCIGPESLH